MNSEADLLCMVCKASGPEPIGVEFHMGYASIAFSCEACNALWQVQIFRDEGEDRTAIDLVILKSGDKRKMA